MKAIGLWLAAALALVALSADDSAAPVPLNTGSDPAPPVVYAPVPLLPVPVRAVARCRSIQARAGVSLLCPTLLPRAIFGGVPGTPPRAVSVQPTGDFFRRRIAGVDIAYGAPWEGPGWRAHRWRNRPCCFLHFDVFRRAPGLAAIPKGARPATLGGRHGLLAQAREGSFYGSELYWANHVRFLWHERGVLYIATLHTFGEAETERLLGRLIASLRPVNAIRVPASRGTPVGVTPNALAAGASSLWVASLGDLSSNFRGTVYRIDPTTAAVVARLRAGPGPHALAFADRAVWAVTSNAISRLDPTARRRTASIQVGRFPKGIASGGGRVWVVNAAPFSAHGSLVAIDPATNRLSGRAVPLGRAPVAVAATRDAVWVVDELEGILLRIDPARRRIAARIKVGRSPTSVAAGPGDVWVANTGDGTISRVDPKTNRVTMTLRIGLAPRGLAIGAGAVWVASTGDGAVRRLDPHSGRISLAASGLGDPLAVAVAHGHLWVSSNGGGEVVRLRLP